MIELRKADIEEELDVNSEKRANCGEAFSKLQKIFILLFTGQKVNFQKKKLTFIL
jgi:hypothetical protein